MLSVNSFGAKFQTTFVVCFSFLTNYRLKRSLYVKLKDWMLNSVDPDETALMSRFIWIYAVCKSLLLSPVAVKELRRPHARTHHSLESKHGFNACTKSDGPDQPAHLHIMIMAFLFFKNLLAVIQSTIPDQTIYYPRSNGTNARLNA